MNPIEKFLAIVSERIVWPATPNRPARYEIWGDGRQGRVVVEIEAGGFVGTLIDAAADLPLSAPLTAFVGEAIEILRAPGALWVGLLPRGIRRGDTITLYFPRSGVSHDLAVADFASLAPADQLPVLFAGNSISGGGYYPWTKTGLWGGQFKLDRYEIDRRIVARPGAVAENVGWLVGGKLAGTVQHHRRQAETLQLEQIAQFDPAFVGISLGESDAGYIELLKGVSRLPFWKISSTEIAQRIRSVYPKLVMVFESVQAVAPDAMVLALGCFRPFPEDGTESMWVRPWFSKEAQAIVNDAADQLAAIQQTAALVAGVHFLPLAPLFADHGICSPTGKELIKGPALHVIPLFREMAFHPKPDGHGVIAEAATRLVVGPNAGPRTRFGLPQNPEPSPSAPAWL